VRLAKSVQEIKMFVADMIPGGFYEMVVLRNYCIINGDNYIADIYQVME
jgi:hypothetical protein